MGITNMTAALTAFACSNTHIYEYYYPNNLLFIKFIKTNMENKMMKQKSKCCFDQYEGSKFIYFFKFIFKNYEKKSISKTFS